MLVLDASAMAGSAAAVVHGFDTLVPELRLSAVVCNNVAGEGHYVIFGMRSARAAVPCSSDIFRAIQPSGFRNGISVFIWRTRRSPAVI